MRIKQEEAKTGHWAVSILESERGWGNKIDEIIYFTEQDEAITWANEYNVDHNPAGPVPDWYMLALAPRQIK